MENKDHQESEYKTLDKDYGRTKMVGSGYGELDSDEYAAFESLIK